ncbi:MAG: thermopsin family protease [Thermoplasmata archaeon]|nr:thermopsin family protease [Thermoplasmata archaeon]
MRRDWASGASALLVTILVVAGSVGLLPSTNGHPVPGGTSPEVQGSPPPRGGADPSVGATTGSAGAPVSPDWSSPPAPAGMGPAASRTATLASAIASAGVPLRDAFLPNLDARVSGPSGATHVEPTYSTVPAPMGIADLGLENQSGVIVPTILTTPRIAGTFAPTAFSGLSVDSGAPDAYGVQVNAVLTNVTLFGNSSYQFWTQNVVEYSTFSHQLSFLDNVWNFSGSSGALSRNAIVAHGPNGTQVGTTFYYALGPVLSMGYPFTLSLFLDSGWEAGGNVVYFNYTLTNATESRSGSFDYVEFNSTVGGALGSFPSAEYLADGATYDPLGLPDDFEIDVVGPGGGSNFDALNASAALNLYYWSNSTQSYVVVPAAFDAGAETGETSTGLAFTWTPNGDSALRGSPGPAAHLGQGPSLLSGEWGVAPTSSGIAVLDVRLAPENGFTFIGPGPSPSIDSFGWAPPAGSYDLPPGTYSIWSLASEDAPARSVVSLLSGVNFLNVTLLPDAGAGVYTPLWAFDDAGLANISSSCIAGSCTLLNNELGPIGAEGGDGRGTFFPWFGAFNDFFFPVFPGVFLQNLANVVVASPPSFTVSTPAWLVNDTVRFGTPATNDLGLFFYDDSNVTLANGAAIGGWWFEPAYFGASAPQYSVVFWNTSSSSVVGNTFTTGGGALFFYGGENNVIWNNTFLEYVPLAANPGSVSGGVHGSNGLFDADFGDARSGGPGCACGDVVYNNVFGDYHPAYSPTLDPYTGLAPRLPFESLWNVTPRAGPNILGGNELGGNYWWNYGSSLDPYWVLPYNASGNIALGGDAHPLVPTLLVTVTFAVEGLPAGTEWHVGVYTSSGLAFNASTGASLTELWPEGEYFYTADSIGGAYGIPSTGIFVVGSSNLTVTLVFYPLFGLTFSTVNFPAGGFWAITLSSTLWGAFIDLGNVAQFPAQVLAAGPYNYTISPPAGYTVYPTAGSVNLTANATVQLTFSKEGAPGALYITLAPASGAQLWVDGVSVPNASAGSVNLSLPAGIHSVYATDPGYLPYYNNVSLAGGGTTELFIVFTLLPGPNPGNATAPSTLPWIVAGVFGAVAVGLAATLGYVYSRRRPPAPPTSPYTWSPKR